MRYWANFCSWSRFSWDNDSDTGARRVTDRPCRVYISQTLALPLSLSLYTKAHDTNTLSCANKHIQNKKYKLQYYVFGQMLSMMQELYFQQKTNVINDAWVIFPTDWFSIQYSICYNFLSLCNAKKWKEALIMHTSIHTSTHTHAHKNTHAETLVLQQTYTQMRRKNARKIHIYHTIILPDILCMFDLHKSLAT